MKKCLSEGLPKCCRKALSVGSPFKHHSSTHLPPILIFLHLLTLFSFSLPPFLLSLSFPHLSFTLLPYISLPRSPFTSRSLSKISHSFLTFLPLCSTTKRNRFSPSVIPSFLITSTYLSLLSLPPFHSLASLPQILSSVTLSPIFPIFIQTCLPQTPGPFLLFSLSLPNFLSLPHFSFPFCLSAIPILLHLLLTSFVPPLFPPLSSMCSFFL